MHSIKLKRSHIKVVGPYSAYGQTKSRRVDYLGFAWPSQYLRLSTSSELLMFTTIYTPGLEPVSWPRSIHDKREPVADGTTRT